jgi:hypothetical protein
MTDLNPGDGRERRISRFGDAVKPVHPPSSIDQEARRNTVRSGHGLDSVSSLPQGEIPQAALDHAMFGRLQDFNSDNRAP